VPHSVSRIRSAILEIRGLPVLLDRDLAELHGVTTKALNQAVARNQTRFPKDFHSQLTKAEFENWRSRNVISNSGAKMGLRRQPHAFTEQGVAMLSSVLQSERAAEVNTAIMRTLVRMRQLAASHQDIARELEALDRKTEARLGAGSSQLFDRWSRGRRRSRPSGSSTSSGRPGKAECHWGGERERLPLFRTYSVGSRTKSRPRVWFSRGLDGLGSGVRRVKGLLGLADRGGCIEMTRQMLEGAGVLNRQPSRESLNRQSFPTRNNSLYWKHACNSI
jgi:hypothetical protein